MCMWCNQHLNEHGYIVFYSICVRAYWKTIRIHAHTHTHTHTATSAQRRTTTKYCLLHSCCLKPRQIRVEMKLSCSLWVCACVYVCERVCVWVWESVCVSASVCVCIVTDTYFCTTHYTTHFIHCPLLTTHYTTPLHCTNRWQTSRMVDCSARQQSRRRRAWERWHDIAR
jgi:hypothetical protein